MNKVFESKINFDEGFNCAQSVFVSFANDFGIDEITSLKLTTGFVAGFAYRGEICGAVVGAFLVLGLKFGSGIVNDEPNKEKTYEMIKAFEKEFVENFGSIKCNQLLNIDISIKEEREIASKNGLFESNCPFFVQKASEIINKLIIESDEQ